ncbi:hypothetical protein CYMTET_33181 [Cymbomonas tetramitiformis]|uniref:Uncharacterized protein n=1 Tax=Cymbomonas tetramitiformis TaxID=36881 RepID=A0AAE0FDL5_9CHLO|nr:hypothetical protein CYMTET_33181 [Cymbomonas tetramitiformis]|eukprot:gene10335-12221_t
MEASCIIFDFDKTLTTEEVGMFEINTDIGNKIFGGEERARMLTTLLTYLNDNGIYTFIASRNSRHVITKALELSGWNEHFTGIFGYENACSIEHGASQTGLPLKSGLIREKVLEAYNISPSNALFIDDDPHNIKDVMRLACDTIWVEGFGLGEEDEQRIRDWVDARTIS